MYHLFSRLFPLSVKFFLVNLRRQDKIVFVETTDLVGVDLNRDMIPAVQMQIGMMPLGLGQCPDPIDETQRLLKILEDKLLKNPGRFVGRQRPLRETRQQSINLGPTKRRNIPATGDALFFGQLRHRECSNPKSSFSQPVRYPPSGIVVTLLRPP